MTTRSNLRSEFRHRFVQRLALAFIIIVIAAIIAIGIWQNWTSYNQKIEEAEITSANLVRSAAQHAEDAIKELDSFSSGMVERVEWYGINQVDKKRMRQLFKNQAAMLFQLYGVFVYDKDGNWIVTDKENIPANANNSDREYFIYHKLNAHDRQMHIGPVIISRSTGDLVIPISRRINNSDGSFAGVFLATLRVDYFTTFYTGFQMDEQGNFVIALNDGTVLARRPFDAGVIGTSLAKGEIYTQYLPYAPSGTAHITSVVDGIERINSYKQLDRYPVVVQAGLSKQAMLASWYRGLYKSALFMSVATLGVLAFGIVLLRQIRSGITIEKELSQAHLALEKLALQDGLTGLANRRHLDAVLPVEMSRAKRTNAPLGLIMIDIDHFKRYNDLYGHPAGDECIKAVGEAVKASIRRAGDLAVRYGGEEITVLLPSTDESGAHRVAEQISNTVRELRILHEGSETGYVTISIGLHVYMPLHTEMTTDALVKAADDALYLAKRGGRNRIHPVRSQL
ncbi:sensor domain-containing diguanylate cyclase [Phytohalomonas tamaricis]|uniref:sensor domain-containing diguanylate cyclase n=1 Tax=Phytohalomonas tamaricis TaxID=2081032 RepID=UPI0021D44C25|nr:sensor domain-containing diguanylate cyclase [Phytohalomonas tamaricis]